MFAINALGRVVGAVGGAVSGTYGFVKRHWKPIAVSTVMVGSAVAITKYVRAEMERQEEEKATMLRMKAHFETTQRTSNKAIEECLPRIREALVVLLPLEQVQTRLEAATSKEDKKAIWEELKILCFSRMIASIYSLVLLVLFMRVELNILGRQLYLDSIVNVDVPLSARETLNRQFLSFFQYFIQIGLPLLAAKIQDATRRAMAGAIKSPKKYAPSEIGEILSEVRRAMEQDPWTLDSARDPELAWSAIVSSLLPPVETEDEFLESRGASIGSKLHLLLTESRQRLVHPDCHMVLGACLDACFNMVNDELTAKFNLEASTGEAAASTPPPPNPQTTGTASASPPADNKFSLARVSPWIARIGESVTIGEENAFAGVLTTRVPLVDSYSVVIFSDLDRPGLYEVRERSTPV